MNHLHQPCPSPPRGVGYTASTEEAGAWLHDLPSSLGRCMANDTMHIAVGLHLGAPLCRPHTCCRCGEKVGHLGVHGLSCWRSEDQDNRHTAIKHKIHRALSTSKNISLLQLSVLYCSDGKRPDGVSVIPWKRGNILCFSFSRSWHCSCAAEGKEVVKIRPSGHYSYFHSSGIEYGYILGFELTNFICELGLTD